MSRGRISMFVSVICIVSIRIMLFNVPSLIISPLFVSDNILSWCRVAKSLMDATLLYLLCSPALPLLHRAVHPNINKYCKEVRREMLVGKYCRSLQHVMSKYLNDVNLWRPDGTRFLLLVLKSGSSRHYLSIDKFR